MGKSDTPLIDHLVMREFVSGPPSYRSIHRRVCDKTPSLRKSSWAVCGFRTEYFEKRQFFGSWFLFKLQVFEDHPPFVETKYHMHMLRVYGHRCWRRSPRQVSAVIRLNDKGNVLLLLLQAHLCNRTWNPIYLSKYRLHFGNTIRDLACAWHPWWYNSRSRKQFGNAKMVVSKIQ